GVSRTHRGDVYPPGVAHLQILADLKPGSLGLGNGVYGLLHGIALIGGAVLSNRGSCPLNLT
nr:hypothetical protein [Streptomyces sp. DSM 41633]